MTLGKSMIGQRATQDLIFDDVMEKERPVTIYLKNGVPVKGVVKAHDSYTVYMNTETNSVLIFKHAVTSVFPAKISHPAT